MRESLSDAVGRLVEALDVLKWAYIDSLLRWPCPRCKQKYKFSESRYFPYLTTTWGESCKVCPDCYDREHRWAK